MTERINFLTGEKNTYLWCRLNNVICVIVVMKLFLMDGFVIVGVCI